MPHYLSELQATFAAQAARPALRYHGESISYADLETRIRRCAGWLQSLGVAPGDRVVLYTPDKLPFLIAHLATLYAGAVSLPLNFKFTREEMKFFLADSEPKVIVAGREQRGIVESLRAELPALGQVVEDSAVLQAASASFAPPAVAAEDPALMIYSSGTTGWPKGVVHSHANLGSALRALQKCWRIAADDVVINVLPLFHVHGLCFGTQLTLLAGACVHIDDFDAQGTLKIIGQGTVFMAVPTIYYRFLEQPGFREAAKGWQSIRLFTCGSAPIRPEVLPDLEAILGRPIINRYGMTEAHVITSLPLDGPWPTGSVGLPIEGIELQVIGEDGNETRPGEVGAVRIRGPNLFPEYWRKPDATRAAFASGWFDTGDLGQRDSSGFLTLVGRKNDLIITNGYNVYPQVVERVVNDCPGVKESAVLGLPDERRGERVAVAVVKSDPALDEERLKAHWGERLIDYQRPLTVVFVDSLPRNTMGKVLRRELREVLERTV